MAEEYHKSDYIMRLRFKQGGTYINVLHRVSVSWTPSTNTSYYNDLNLFKVVLSLTLIMFTFCVFN